MTGNTQKSVTINATDPEDLHRLVALSEEIKVVRKAAALLNLTGINAILLAGRAGESARGFGVLSSQLREFTRGLSTCMNKISALIDVAVSAASVHARQRRLTAGLARTADVDERCKELVAPAIDACAKTEMQHLARIGELRDEARCAIEKARDFGLTGSMLARTAKIEATYGASFRQEMSVVSGEFEHTVQTIVASLANLTRVQ